MHRGWVRVTQLSCSLMAVRKQREGEKEFTLATNPLRSVSDVRPLIPAFTSMVLSWGLMVLPRSSSGAFSVETGRVNNSY